MFGGFPCSAPCAPPPVVAVAGVAAAGPRRLGGCRAGGRGPTASAGAERAVAGGAGWVGGASRAVSPRWVQQAARDRAVGGWRGGSGRSPWRVQSRRSRADRLSWAQGEALGGASGRRRRGGCRAGGRGLTVSRGRRARRWAGRPGWVSPWRVQSKRPRAGRRVGWRGVSGGCRLGGCRASGRGPPAGWAGAAARWVSPRRVQSKYGRAVPATRGGMARPNGQMSAGVERECAMRRPGGVTGRLRRAEPGSRRRRGDRKPAICRKRPRSNR
jgi:hypothetical protein